MLNCCVLNAEMNIGCPENGIGDMGPMAMNGNCFDSGFTADCGSLKLRYRFIASLSPPASSVNLWNSSPSASPYPKSIALSCIRISWSIPCIVWLMNIHPMPYFLVSLTARLSSLSSSRSCWFRFHSPPDGTNRCASSSSTRVLAVF